MGIIDTLCGWFNSAVDFIMANGVSIAFVVLAAIAILAAILVVTSEETMHSAFYLALVFFCIGVTYFFLAAPFIGVIQIMVYVGAITMLFAFGLMLTRRGMSDEGGESS
ncbi:MAG: NADH-quinone oxidoreductase subunit J [Candidatus Methanomethylophilaceae archaeon]|nr:NADH-quinone oxidoreductase subunit J [Candidatus Methanomethylophilaceae archaeon]